MSVPAELRYTKTHEWAREEDDGTVVVGITHYAQEQLGEVVYVELPEVGRTVDTGEELGTLESVKAVAEFFAPVAGEVVEVNEALGEEPGLVNEDPYGDGWLLKLRSSGESGDLMDAEQYEAFLAEESH